MDFRFYPRELVFLVLQQEPTAIGAFVMMEFSARGNGDFAKRRMSMDKPWLVFDQSVSSSELSSIDLRTLISTPGRMQRLNVTAWNLLIKKIRELRPNDAESLDSLIARRTEQHRLLDDSNRSRYLNEQRDALGLALDIGDQDRQGILKSMNVADAENARSVLDLIDSITLPERNLLEHDCGIFKKLLGVLPTRAINFGNARDRSVRVMVVDQTDFETALGIDLIIYQSCFNSFLLLQYKRMKKQEEGWKYAIPASSNLHEQLGRMQAFNTKVARSKPSQPSLGNYRLNSGPFYFKFCEQIRHAARDDSLTPGITLAADHVHHFLGLPEARGTFGGLSIGYHNCPRYLNNTEFILLARNGWIGTGSQSSQLMKEVLEANNQEGIKAMLAVIDVPHDKSAAWRRRTASV